MGDERFGINYKWSDIIRLNRPVRERDPDPVGDISRCIERLKSEPYAMPVVIISTEKTDAD